MKKNVINFKFKTIENSLKPTIFAFSKWNALHLQAKIRKFGDISTYLDFLIEKYSFRIYNGFAQDFDLDSLRNQVNSHENLFIKCEVYESTLYELTELAQVATLSKRSMFQLLISWDISPPRPCQMMAV